MTKTNNESGSNLSFNYQYLLDMLKPKQKVLDYGCGAGEIVIEGRKRHLNICGADVFYKGAKDKEKIKKAHYLNKIIFEIKNNRIPFKNETFDVAVCNQVFEHVKNLNLVLKEIHRVLKANGRLIALFPSKGVIYEGHIGVPCSHWFAKKSKSRFIYTLALRTLGIGFNKNKKSPIKWTQDELNWLDKYTKYRSEKEIRKSLSQYFLIEFLEDDYVFKRLQKYNIQLPKKLKNLKIFRHLTQKLFRRVGGMVIMAKKS